MPQRADGRQEPVKRATVRQQRWRGGKVNKGFIQIAFFVEPELAAMVDEKCRVMGRCPRAAVARMAMDAFLGVNRASAA